MPSASTRLIVASLYILPLIILKSSANPGAFSGTWDIIDVDADWDDEFEQDELRIEAQVSCSGSNPSASINGFTFHVTILAALPAA
jgi:hypothetical protein